MCCFFVFGLFFGLFLFVSEFIVFYFQPWMLVEIGWSSCHGVIIWVRWLIYLFFLLLFFHVFSHTLRKSSFPNKYKLSFYSYHMCKWHLPPSSIIIRLPLTRGLCLKQKHYAQYLQKTPFLVYLQIKFFFFLVIADLVLVCPHLCSARHQWG